jgi:TIR domain
MPESSRKSVLLLAPFDGGFENLFRMVSSAASHADADAVRIDNIFTRNRPQLFLPVVLESAQAIICDLTGTNVNVLYELGVARNSRKPIILITQRLEHIPFDLAGAPVLRYSNAQVDTAEFIQSLATLLRSALESPEVFLRESAHAAKERVFISYSHNDASFLERLLIHLKPIEKAGRLRLFVDTRLRAGDKWKKEIQQALKEARVAILLVSADFLASDFIVDNELPPLLQKAEKTGTRIVPLVLKPCRFARDPNLREFQAINDPARPLISLPEWEQEQIYDKVAALIEDLSVT